MLTKEYEFAFAVADENTAASVKDLRAEYEAMPSGTATLKVADKIEDMDRQGIKSVRAFARIGNSLVALGILGAENSRILDAISRAVMVNYSVWLLYQSVTMVVKMMQTIEMAQVAALTAAWAAVPLVGWGMIALAAGTAAAVYTGLKFASGAWKLPSFDLTNPTARRQSLGDARARTVP